MKKERYDFEQDSQVPEVLFQKISKQFGDKEGVEISLPWKIKTLDPSKAKFASAIGLCTIQEAKGGKCTFFVLWPEVPTRITEESLWALKSLLIISTGIRSIDHWSNRIVYEKANTIMIKFFSDWLNTKQPFIRLVQEILIQTLNLASLSS